MSKPILFTFAFIAFTIIGTVLHELGHIAVARALGYKTTLHYGSLSWENKYLKYSNQLFQKYSIKENLPLIEKEKLKAREIQREKDGFWITLGGPMQTMGIGLIGIWLLYMRRKNWHGQGLNFVDWLAVFLTLFWSRQVFNMVGRAQNIFAGSKTNKSRNDELR